MFDTLRMLLELYGPASKGAVWAHNSHLGDASATAMGERGEHNVGQLARQTFGPAARLVGFGTHTGTVAAASDWGRSMQVMEVRPSHPRSYERVAHESGVDNFIQASLPRQFDEWVWFDRSEAVTPIGEERRDELAGLPETFPFGL
jgi:erythromycin esterase-like protein